MKILYGLLLVLLAILAAFVGIVYTKPNAKTADVKFTYQRATEYTDGTPLLLEAIKYTRIYCDGKQVAQEAGADGEISAALTGGSHDCYGTHVDTNDMESNPSVTVTRFVEP
ncbi:MAG: hypothetical protein KJO95_12835 [Gammaproteobacteria bacterium]|nr:hypothetical protein [Gammaproteobacteria bacterium]MBU2676638.1 hypothetical protein [Gammaproteobacteria bacterium]NNL50372.1 hypothetical protein [Woeseiaceae bacterium]